MHFLQFNCSRVFFNQWASKLKFLQQVAKISVLISLKAKARAAASEFRTTRAGAGRRSRLFLGRRRVPARRLSKRCPKRHSPENALENGRRAFAIVFEQYECVRQNESREASCCRPNDDCLIHVGPQTVCRANRHDFDNSRRCCQTHCGRGIGRACFRRGEHGRRAHCDRERERVELAAPERCPIL